MLRSGLQWSVNWCIANPQRDARICADIYTFFFSKKENLGAVKSNWVVFTLVLSAGDEKMNKEIFQLPSSFC